MDTQNLLHIWDLCDELFLSDMILLFGNEEIIGILRAGVSAYRIVKLCHLRFDGRGEKYSETIFMKQINYLYIINI